MQYWRTVSDKPGRRMGGRVGSLGLNEEWNMLVSEEEAF